MVTSHENTEGTLESKEARIEIGGRINIPTKEISVKRALITRRTLN